MKRYLHEKRRFITAAEHDHVLIVPGDHSGVLQAPRSRTYTIASPRVPKTGGYRALINLRRIAEIVEREQPDVIESADPYQVGWYVAHLADMFRVPAIAFYHSHFYDAYFERVAPRSLAEHYVRALYNRFDLTLVASPSLARELQAWGVHNVRIQPLGVDASIFSRGEDRATTRDSLGLSSDRFLLLYVGRLSAEKNAKALLDAFAQLPPKRWHLLVIGDGPERARLEQLSHEQPNVTWIKYCAEPAELARYYRAADLFVHPGQRETFGLAAIEAQACGTPVLAIGQTRLNEVIAHDQDWWATENNASALAHAIQRAATLDLVAIGAAASEQVHRRFAWNNVFERLLCIYREVCTNYQRGLA